jgi:hypothetical protein
MLDLLLVEVKQGVMFLLRRVRMTGGFGRVIGGNR